MKMAVSGFLISLHHHHVYYLESNIYYLGRIKRGWDAQARGRRWKSIPGPNNEVLGLRDHQRDVTMIPEPRTKRKAKAALVGDVFRHSALFPLSQPVGYRGETRTEL